MATPIKLRVDVDMDALIRAVQDAGYSVEKLGDEFEGVENAADSATTGTARDLDKIGTAADDAGRDVQGIGDDFDAAQRDASTSADGIAKLFQAAGPILTAVTEFGPEFTKIFGGNTEAIKQQSEELFNAMVESGGKALTAQQKLAAAQEVINDPARLKQAQDIARATGDLGTAILAVAGDSDALSTATDQLSDAYERNPAEQLAGGFAAATTALGDATKATELAEGKFDALSTVQDTLAGKTDKANEKAREFIDLFNEAAGLPAINKSVTVTVKPQVDQAALNRMRNSIGAQVAVSVSPRVKPI